MSYPITIVPHAIGTPDGFMFKTSKSKVVHYLTDKLVPPGSPPNSETLYMWPQKNVLTPHLICIESILRTIQKQITTLFSF